MVLFEEAVEADPEFAQGLAGLASTRFLVTMDDPDRSPAELERAHDEARRALELDTTSAEVREVFKYIESGMDQIMPSHAVAPPHEVAVTAGRRVIGLDTAWVGAMTRLGSALEVRMRREAMDEGDYEGVAQRFLIARRLLGEGQFSGASDVLKELVEESPEMAPAWEMLVRSEVSAQDADGIVAAYEDWQQSGSGPAPDIASVERLRAAVDQEGMRGYWTWTLERLQQRSDAGRSVSSVEMASAHAGLGHTDEALQLLADGLANGDRGLLMIQTDPVWDDLRRDARFQKMSREIRARRFAPTGRRPGGGNR